MRHIGRSDKAELLVAEARISHQAQALSELRVVAEFGMGVQRQVIGEEADIGGHQAPHPRRQPAGQPPVLAAPEQPVVNQQRVGAVSDRGVDESQAGGDPRDEPAHRGSAFELQTVRPIILEAFGAQQCLQAGFDVCARDHGGILHKEKLAVGTGRCGVELWLIFAQSVTVALGALFVVLTLKPEWLPRSAANGMLLPAPTVVQMQSAPAAAASGGTPTKATTGFALAASRAAPAVVSVTATRLARNPHADDPRFRFFFGDQAGTQQQLEPGLRRDRLTPRATC